MKISQATALSLLGAVSASASTPGKHGPPCRFALDWTTEEILENTEDFISDMLYWEGKFHVDGIAYNKDNGMTYDGSQIDYVTGERTEKHTFSASSKEVRCQPAAYKTKTAHTIIVLANYALCSRH